MSKAKTNALDALRALIAERQQYDQWISTLNAKREGTPEHVFERVQADYRSRLDRVVTEIKSHAEELQLSISTLSSRLVEVARDEDTRREGLQEAELRAAVGEYEPEQWQQIKSEAESALERIAADRESLDSQLGELRAIQKLSEMGPGASAEGGASQLPQLVDIPVPAAEPSKEPETRAPEIQAEPAPLRTDQPGAASSGHRSGTAAAARPAPEPMAANQSSQPEPIAEPPANAAALDNVASAAAAASNAAAKPRTMKSPVGGVAAVKARSEAARPDSAKTLKCPECGTANYPTEWYCERCGGELATM
jgi:hypothetical protein